MYRFILNNKTLEHKILKIHLLGGMLSDNIAGFFAHQPINNVYNQP